MNDKKEKSNLPLLPVTFGALALYSEYDLMQDKFIPFEVAEKLAKDQELLKKVWQWTIDKPLPDDLFKIDSADLVGAMYDFLLSFRERFNS